MNTRCQRSSLPGRPIASAILAGALLGLSAPRAPAQAEAPAPEPDAAQADAIRMNFRDAPLNQVLDYLSDAAGFVILSEVPDLQGPVTVVSHQPLSADEAVSLLTSILLEKGYGTVRQGRTLKIVSLSKAHQQYLPVRSGADPEAIPRSDELVTQIIPVQYVDAKQLLENLQPLMPETTKLSANESSNSLVMTDTLSNIRRTVEIIRALDTSISSIATVQVFALQYADATDLAEVLNDLFEDTTSNTTRRGSGGRGAFFDRFRGRGESGGDQGQTGTQAEARQAAFRVVAVADERSNSLVVAAPDSAMPTIEQLVQQMDTNVADVTEVQVFPLQNADAVELAEVISGLYEETQNAADSAGSSRFRGPFGRPPESRGNSGNQDSNRALEQAKVVAVGDPRTNSLIVSAARESMIQIAQLIGRLDASSAKRERVYVYPLEHADVDNVAAILRGMFEENGSSASQSQAANPLTTRTTTGASSDLGGEFGRTGGGGR